MGAVAQTRRVNTLPATEQTASGLHVPQGAGQIEVAHSIPMRVYRMSPEERQLIRSDPQAAAAFQAEERALISDPVNGNGFRYLMANYASYGSADGSVRQAMDPWPSQQRLIEALINEPLLVILKTRRMGATLIVAHYAAWLAGLCASTPGAGIINQSKTFTDAKDFLKETRGVLGFLYGWLQPEYGGSYKDAEGRDLKDTDSHLEFLRGAWVQSLAATAGAAHGKTVRLAVLDEFARLDKGDPDAILGGAEPTAEGGGQLVIISTGKGRTGRGATMARIYEGATPLDAAPAGHGVGSGENAYRSLFFGWRERPDRPESFRKIKEANLGLVEAMQNYPETPEEALSGVEEGIAFDPDGIQAVQKAGEECHELRLGGEIQPSGGTQDLGVDWGFSGTGWCLRWDLSRFNVYLPRADQWAQVEADSASHQMMEAAEDLGYPVDMEHYDPGGSGAQVNLTFRRLYRHAVRNTQSVPFGENKRKNVEFMRTMVRRTKEQAHLPLGERYGTLAIDPADAKVVIDQLKAAKLGRDGGLEKEEDQHALDSLIVVINPVRRAWEKAHKDEG